MAERYYPVGIQIFSEIIKGGYVYIAKTDLMWRMQHKRKYIFLSRPDIMSFDNLNVPASAFDQLTEDLEKAPPLLYQSRYLTIKDYNQELDTYTLSIPNQEVRNSYTRN